MARICGCGYWEEAAALVAHQQEQERGVLCRVLHLLQQVGAQAGYLLVEATEEEPPAGAAKPKGKGQGKDKNKGKKDEKKKSDNK